MANPSKSAQLPIKDSKVVSFVAKRKVHRISFKGQVKKTVPNQSMTLKQILQKYTRGEPVPQVAHHFFETRFGDMSQFFRMDHLDRKIFVDGFKEKVTEWGAELKQKEEAAAAAAQAAAATTS